MNGFDTIGQLLGGLGLFILAMKLMTDGLRSAVADRLRDMLTRWTATRIRGIATGALITAVVQSSSAVTVATIGFVNAGLLTLAQALGIVFGANIGTTMTGWLVSLVGFDFQLEVFALPLVGLGTAAWLLGGPRRWSGYGQAALGFGLFFLGLGILKSAFGDLAPYIDLHVISDYGLLGVLLLIAVGFAMTLLTQSSSAALAITLTAAVGGVITVQSAAAVVIGANVGTTSTALFASLGATAAAKRVALAHVLFNAVTAVAALIVLPLLLGIVGIVEKSFFSGGGAAVTLALFHTAFNILGVLLVAPFSHRLSKWLEGRFVTYEEQAGRPRFLDKNVLETPVMAMGALYQELCRTAGIAQKVALEALESGASATPHFTADVAVVDQLRTAIADFAGQLGQRELPEGMSSSLMTAIAATQNLHDITYLSSQLAHSASDGMKSMGASRIENERVVRRALKDILLASTVRDGLLQPGPVDIHRLEGAYDDARTEMLKQGVQGILEAHQLNRGLDELLRLRRLGRRWNRLLERLGTLGHPHPAEPTAADRQD